MILTQAQAEAVYEAMRALNKVGGRIDTYFDNKEIRETAPGWGGLTISVMGLIEERYANQAAFASAYGLK